MNNDQWIDLKGLDASIERLKKAEAKKKSAAQQAQQKEEEDSGPSAPNSERAS